MPPRIDLAAVLARVPALESRPPEQGDVHVPPTPLALLQALRAQGRGWRLDGDRLYADVTTGALPPDLLQALRQQKEDLLTMLEWYEERAGILEYGAGLSRAEAEHEAWIYLEDVKK